MINLSDSDVALAAATAGAAVVRDMYGTRLDRVDKGGGDFATAADLAAEQAILDVIRRERPADGFLGEENGQIGDATGRQWLVDPLCGTLNYAAGMRVVAVNVGLSGGASAVADPFGGEVYYTDGVTARVRRGDADEVLAPSAANGLVEFNLDAPFPSAPAFRVARVLADTRFIERFRPRVVSSTLAVAWVAAGKRAAYLSDGGDLTASVHFAAGLAVCRDAGCVLTDLDGEPLGPGARGLVAAADAETHAALMELIA
ncbi:phosphatase [Actinorhabdospora filicis]|uniref:Phosphatase n=1 Tax=Actinorhabdospora filicis TaxID=1785913 RepID=A0A9W6SQT7_9ACTN|nr:phosphatase [Actinorhabdospora filicis]